MKEILFCLLSSILKRIVKKLRKCLGSRKNVMDGELKHERPPLIIHFIDEIE